MNEIMKDIRGLVDQGRALQHSIMAALLEVHAVDFSALNGQGKCYNFTLSAERIYQLLESAGESSDWESEHPLCFLG